MKKKNQISLSEAKIKYNKSNQNYLFMKGHSKKCFELENLKFENFSEYLNNYFSFILLIELDILKNNKKNYIIIITSNN